MLMDAGMDTGPMLLKAYTPIGILDNTEQLGQILAQLGADLLVETLMKLERQEIEPIPQDSAKATYAPPIKKPDYNVDWSKEAIAIHNQVRAFFPDCTATFRGNPIKIIATAPLGADYFNQLPPKLKVLEQNWPTISSHSARPGEVVSIAKNIGPIIQTGSGFLLLQQIQPAGKRPQSGSDFANGTRLAVGEVFETADSQQ